MVFKLKIHEAVKTLIILSALISLTSFILIPVYYLKILPPSVYTYILASFSTLLGFIIISIVYFKKKSLTAFIKKISWLNMLLRDEITGSLKEASDTYIIKKFRLIDNLLRLNKPVEAVKLSRLVLLKLLEYVKSSNLKHFFTCKNYFSLSLIELIDIWENRLRYALENNGVSLSLAENYFTSVFYIYNFLKHEVKSTPPPEYNKTDF